MTNKENADKFHDLGFTDAIGSKRLDQSKRAHQLAGLIAKHNNPVYPEESALLTINTICIPKMSEALAKIGEYKYRMQNHVSTWHILTHLLENASEAAKVKSIEIDANDGQSIVVTKDDKLLYFGGINQKYKPKLVSNTVKLSMEFLHEISTGFYQHDNLEGEALEQYRTTYFKGDSENQKFIRKELKYKLPATIEDISK